MSSDTEPTLTPRERGDVIPRGQSQDTESRYSDTVVSSDTDPTLTPREREDVIPRGQSQDTDARCADTSRSCADTPRSCAEEKSIVCADGEVTPAAVVAVCLSISLKNSIFAREEAFEL